MFGWALPGLIPRVFFASLGGPGVGVIEAALFGGPGVCVIAAAHVRARAMRLMAFSLWRRVCHRELGHVSGVWCGIAVADSLLVLALIGGADLWYFCLR